MRRSHCWFCRYAGAGVPVALVADWIGVLELGPLGPDSQDVAVQFCTTHRVQTAQRAGGVPVALRR